MKNQNLDRTLCNRIVKSHFVVNPLESGTWTNSKDRNVASSRVTLWVPSEQKFIHVGQDLTISQMLQILADRGNELDIPVIKFLIVEQNDDSVTEDEQPKGT